MKLNTTLIIAIGAAIGGVSNTKADLVLNGGFENLSGRDTFYNDLTGSLADPSWTPPHWAGLSGAESILFQTVGSMGSGENGVETTLLPPTAGWLPANANGGACALMIQSYGGGYNGTKQNLGTIIAGTTYTASADFTQNAGGQPMNYDFFLMNGTKNTALAGIDEVTGGIPTFGEWVNKSFGYTATGADAGDELWIVLRARVPASEVTRGGVDNVSVLSSLTAVPEPSSTLTLGGLVFLGLALRRRSRQGL